MAFYKQVILILAWLLIPSLAWAEGGYGGGRECGIGSVTSRTDCRIFEGVCTSDSYKFEVYCHGEDCTEQVTVQSCNANCEDSTKTQTVSCCVAPGGGGGGGCDIEDPENLAVTRIGNGPDARITWEAPQKNSDKVKDQTVVVSKNSWGILHNCEGPGNPCVINEQLEKTVESYDALGLEPGKYYYVKVTVNPVDGECNGGSLQHYISSCELTPNPEQVDVGERKTLTTQVLEAPFNLKVTYSVIN